MSSNLDSSYFVDGDNAIRKMMDDSYRMSIPLTQQFWNEADIDTRFRCGDQTLWNQIYGTLPLQNRRTFQFNRIRRTVNLPVGYQRRNRKSTMVTPIENSSQETADQFSDTIQWANHNCGFYETLSDAFEGACVTGFNLLSIWLDYRDDPVSGDIRVDNLYHNGCMVDPTFKKRDLSDANFIWKRKWMSKKQAASLMPERTEEIMTLPTQGYRDDKFMFLPENYQYSIQGFVPYDEYWYLDSREVEVIVDLETGESTEFKGTKDELKLYLRMFPQLKAIKQTKPTTSLAICIANKVFYKGPNPYGIDRYPFVGVYCYFEPEIPYYSLKMQGIVRGLRDAQFLYNRRQVIVLDMLESQINSGIKFKESALKDPRDAFLTGQGRMLALRDSASMDDVQMIQAPDVPQGVIELSKMMSDEIAQISGVNEELLGSATDEKAGILAQLRQGAGLTTLQVIFDQLDGSQKQAGQIFMDMIQANFTPHKIRKITGKEPTAEFHDQTFQKYDCSIEDGVMTSSQRQMQFAQLLQLREMGMDIPADLLLETVNLQRKDELIKALNAQKEQAQQAQQAEAQQAQESQQVLNNSLNSKAESDKALAAERMNKMHLEQAETIERMARANEEQDNATLAKIKAIKELEQIDLNQLEKMLTLLSNIKAQEQPQQQVV